MRPVNAMAVDDASFQEQLIELKMLISAINFNYENVSSEKGAVTQSTARDTFAEQLNDFRAALNVMQFKSVNYCNRVKYAAANGGELNQASRSRTSHTTSNAKISSLFDVIHKDLKAANSRLEKLEGLYGEVDEPERGHETRSLTPSSTDGDSFPVATNLPLDESFQGKVLSRPINGTEPPHWASHFPATAHAYGLPIKAPARGQESHAPPTHTASPGEGHLHNEAGLTMQVSPHVYNAEPGYTNAQDHVAGPHFNPQQCLDQILHMQQTSVKDKNKITALERRITDKDHIIQTFYNQVVAKCAELANLKLGVQGQYDGFIEVFSREFRHLYQSYMNTKNSLTAAATEVRRLERTMHGQEDHYARVSDDQVQEIQRLEELCEQKDAVIRHQKDFVVRKIDETKHHDEEVKFLTEQLKNCEKKLRNQKLEHLERGMPQHGTYVTEPKFEDVEPNMPQHGYHVDNWYLTAPSSVKDVNSSATRSLADILEENTSSERSSPAPASSNEEEPDSSIPVNHFPEGWHSGSLQPYAETESNESPVMTWREI